MEIQWPLVAFTCLTGAGGWLLACVAADHFAKRTSKTNATAIVVGFVIVVLGGLASVLHLSHPENILAALNRPQSGIFTEAVLTGLTAAMCFVYWVLYKKKAGEIALKVFAVAAAVFGVVLSYSAGASYVMASQPTWNTLLLPLGFVGVAIPLGVATYLLVACIKGEEKLRCYQQTLLIGGLIALVTSLLYAISSGAFHDEGIGCCIGAVVLSGIACAAIGALLLAGDKFKAAQAQGEASVAGDGKKDGRLLVLVVAALVCALIGSICFHVLQYTGADLINNFYEML